jgi:hypothetical protein
MAPLVKRSAFAACVLVALGAVGGCGEDPRPVLVALGGCGLDEIELSVLELVPRGDFPAAAANGIVVDGGRSGIDGIPDDAVAITVEGKFADATLAVGRTSRLDGEDGRIPVYFAPEDELCAVERGVVVDFQDVGAMAVGPRGDIVMVGGRDDEGRLLDDIVHTRDVDDAVRRLDRPITSPTTGLTVVPIGDRRFAAIGGATSDGRVLGDFLPIDVESQRVGPAIRIDAPGVDAARSYHASAVLPDGRVLVTGGCTQVDLDSRCLPSPGHVLDSGFIVDARVEPVLFSRAPAMLVARFGHELLVARDGTVFAVGGRNHLGRGVVTIERWTPDGRDWTPYGRTELLDLAGERTILGAALLEGGLIVVAIDDGSIAWVTDAGAGRWPTWCDGDAQTLGCFHDESSVPIPPEHRRLVVLPGERVLADAWLLPFPMLGTNAADAVDLSEPEPDQSTAPPGRRTASAMVALADGTVFVAGGRDPDALDAGATPLLARLRPQLDGADERIPDVAGFEAASFVLHDPDRIGFDTDHVVMSSEGGEHEFPDVWAHVRSFRSASFRFDVQIQVFPRATPAECAANDEQSACTADCIWRPNLKFPEQSVCEPRPPRPHLVLSQGAFAGTSIRFGETITGYRRDAAGTVFPFSCSAEEIDFVSREVTLRLDVQPESIVVQRGSEVVANCPGGGDVPSAIGIGVSGEGTLLAYEPLLTRI